MIAVELIETTHMNIDGNLEGSTYQAFSNDLGMGKELYWRFSSERIKLLRGRDLCCFAVDIK